MEEAPVDGSPWEAFPVLHTERFLLLQPELEHAAALLEVFGDEAAMCYLQSAPVRGPEDCERRVAAWKADFQAGRGLHWIIQPRAEPESLVGVFALHYWSRANRRAEMGSYLQRRWWGRGVSTEITREVLRFAFHDLDLHRVELRCDPRNTASMVVARKLGLRLEGVLRDYVWVEGKGFVDEAVHALLRSEYLGREGEPG
jgi:ribosomal-protein-alanine N-acetyltransferase